MSTETLLVRLVSVEMRMPVLLTKACAERLADAGLVQTHGRTETGRTIRGETAACVRVSFTKLGRDAASTAWLERKAAGYCRLVDDSPGVDMAARRVRLMLEHGLITAECHNPTTVKGQDMPDAKRRYHVALTDLGRQLLET